MRPRTRAAPNSPATGSRSRPPAPGWSDLVADTGSTATTYSHQVPLQATRYYRISAINSAGTGTTSQVTSGNAMNTPPEVIGAEISGNARIVTLFLDEAPVDSPAPPAAAFRINVDGTVRIAGALTANAAFKQIKLVFVGAALRPGETVSVSYTKPETNPLQDAAGLETDSFTDLPVENKLAATVADPPTNLIAEGTSKTSIELSWDAPSYTGGADVAGYKIEVSTTGTGGWSDLVADTGSTATTYAHTGLSSGDTHYYRVSAINSAGAGNASSVAAATTPDLPPEIIGAEMSGNARIVTLVLDEAPVDNPAPPASAFTINVDGTVRTAGALTVNPSLTFVQVIRSILRAACLTSF